MGWRNYTFQKVYLPRFHLRRAPCEMVTAGQLILFWGWILVCAGSFGQRGSAILGLELHYRDNRGGRTASSNIPVFSNYARCTIASEWKLGKHTSAAPSCLHLCSPRTQQLCSSLWFPVYLWSPPPGCKGRAWALDAAQSVCLSVCLSIYLSAYLSTYLPSSIYLSTSPTFSIYLLDKWKHWDSGRWGEMPQITQHQGWFWN